MCIFFSEISDSKDGCQTDISEINEDSSQASCREENGYSKGQDKK